MTPNETDAQVDAQNEASTATTPLEEISSNPSKDIVGGSIPSNVLDRPIESLEDDLIGTKDLQDGLIEYIKRADKPFTIALQGEWGLGKTSFLNLLKTQLCDKNNSLYYSVWIDACDFTLLQSPTSAVINMLQSMVYQIGNLNPTIMADQQGKEYIKKAISFIKNIGKPVLIKTITKGIEIATAGVVSEDITKPVISNLLSNTNEQNNNNQENTLSAVKELRGDITNLIEYIFDPDNKENCIFIENKYQEKQGIVFFIDNLDRIDPTLAVEILEITQNIFNFEKCVFILALDYTIAIRGLQSKLGELTSDNEVIFRKYFDKFVQQSISIPAQSTAVSKFLFKLLEDVNLLKGRELNNFYQLKDTILNFAVNSLDYNPRFIKQFTNTLSLALLINEAHNKNNNNNKEDKNKQSPTGNIERQNTITKSLTFVILCIQISYPQIYRELSSSSFVSEIISAPRIRKSIFNNNNVITREEPTSVLNKWNDKLSEKFKNNRTIESQIFETIDTLRSIEEAAEDIGLFNKGLETAIKISTYTKTQSLFKKQIYDKH